MSFGVKDTLRRKMLEIRISIEDREEKERAILEKAASLTEVAKAKVVALYWPVRGEANLLGLRQLLDAKVCLPKVRGRELCFGYWNGEELEKGAFGIPEPHNCNVDVKRIDLFFVPALALDWDGYRLGYGGGYYDGLIRDKLPHQVFVGVVFSEQLLDRLPADEWDVPVDVVLTDAHLIYPRACSKIWERR